MWLATTTTQGATAARPEENPKSADALNSSSRSLRAKQRAKGGLMARYGEGQLGIETMVTVQEEVFMDSREYPRTIEEDGV